MKQIEPTGTAMFSRNDVNWLGTEFPPTRVWFTQNSTLLPDEQTSFTISLTPVTIEFNQRALSPDSSGNFPDARTVKPDLSLNVVVAPAGPLANYHTVNFDMNQHRFIIFYPYILSQPNSWTSNGLLVNLTDLKESQVVIRCGRAGDLVSFGLRTWNGEDFHLRLEKIKRAQGNAQSPIYYGRFSEVFENSTASQR